MAEIVEVLGDVGDKAKSLFKNKGFLLAAVGVGAVALYTGYKKNKAADNEGGTAYGAIGYAGYPTVGGSADNSSNYYEYMDSMAEGWDERFNDMNDSINDRFDAIGDIIDQMGDNNDYFGGSTITPSIIIQQKDEAAEREAILEQMKYNSSAWHIVTDQATKDALVAENQKLGESIGLTFDSDSGTWWNGGSVAYVTPVQEQAAIEQKTVGKAEYADTWVSNTDYQARINKAIIDGADATTINTLNQQRNAKIAASGTTTEKANTNYDPNTDYQALINKAKATGASREVIENLTAQRSAKINAIAKN